jgi:hypothetical protein
LSEREWRKAVEGDYWFVPQDSADRGEADREREFPFFIYEVAIHKEPAGYVYVVRNAMAGDESVARRFATFEDARCGAEEWFKQKRLLQGSKR